MDINNELQQINTFVKGMNTDVSDALMDSSQYRYAENVRLATNTDENTGELRLIEGNAQFPYNLGEIKAMTSIRNILIVVTKEDKIYKNEDGTGWSLVYKPAEGDTGFGDHLSLVTRWESANNIKLYIADGHGPIMSLNILGGYVEGKENILSTIDCVLEPITTSVYSDDGHLNGVRFQYTYRLYKMGGSSTTLATPSSVLTLYPDEGGFDTSDTLINKSILLNLPNQTTDLYEYMQIFRIAYVKVGDEPVVDMVYDGEILSSFIDSGVSILEISYEEFENMSVFVIFPTIIESKEDYLFAANIQDNVQNIDNKFESIDMRAYSTGDYLSDYDYNILFDPTRILTYNKEYWYIPNTLTIGGKGDYILWTPTKLYIYVDENNKKYETEQDVDSGNSIKQQISSLRLNEVYRYGAVLYDETGQHSSVKWIGDIMLGNGMFPDNDIPVFVKTTQDGLSVYKFSIYGIQFTVDWEKILQACNNKCKQIEIVRCPRTSSDRITITQGIAGYPLRIYDSSQTPFEGSTEVSTTYICPPGLLSTNKVIVYRITDNGLEYDDYAISDPKYLMFSSPEYVYNTQALKDRLNNIQNIKLCCDYSLSYNLKQTTLSGVLFVLIKTDDHNFDFGVPYIARKTTSDITDFVREATIGSFSLGNQDTLLWDVFLFLNIDEEYRNGTRLFANLDQRDNYVKVFFSHPTMYVSEQNIYGLNNNITGIGFAQPSLNYSIYDGDALAATGDLSFIKNTSTVYLNWSAPLAFPLKEITTQRNNENGLGVYNYVRSYYPIGSSGECILIELAQLTDFSSMTENGQNYSVLRMPVLSMRTTSNTPYGGRYTVDQSTYSSFGNVIKNESPVSIFDGDCYPGIFVYNSSHTWQSQGSLVGMGQCNVYSVPLYSDIDLSATFGDLFPRILSRHKYQLQNKAGAVSAFYIQDKDAYLYNSSYGELNSAITYSAIEYTKLDSSLYDTRIFHSAIKRNNEHVDNWLLFQEMDFIDVDSRFGRITNMKLFKDKLLFWLEHASGILSVNERTVLNDIKNNDIVLGTGGVLQRYDYISTIYGMKPHQYEAETQSNYTQYWWDGYNKEILAYTGGIELTPLSKTKSLTNYINQREESEHPMLAYDTKYDEVLAQVVTDNVSTNTLVYNELIQAFSSVYTFTPLYRALVGNDLYLTDNNSIYLHNKQDIKNQSMLFDSPIFPKVKIVVNKNNIYTKTFDNITFGGRMYNGSFIPLLNTPLGDTNGLYIQDKDHMNSPMHHIKFTFETPLKQQSSVRGDNAISVDEYDYRLAIPRNGSYATVLAIGSDIKNIERKIEYGNRMRGKTMQCEIASDYNSTDFSLQYITTKFRMSWS